MDDNYLYNLKIGFTLISRDPYSSSSALGTILLKCAQCMSDHQNDDTLPSCRYNCSLWYFMSEKRYELTDKEVYQNKLNHLSEGCFVYTPRFSNDIIFNERILT